jgi:folate receptor
MGEIYANGKDLCETMWGDSFVYEEDEPNGYTMWFLLENPNPSTSKALFTDDHEKQDQCYLEYNHKETPGPEDLKECIPWSDHACCLPETVKDAQTLKENQGGPEYHWDRCGSLSAECEKYFIEEACFYECEPAAGLFRKYPEDERLHDREGHEVHDTRCDKYHEDYNETHAEKNCTMGGHGHNSWEIHRMPIKASYCNAFYEACKNDLFCGHGNFFECAKISPDADAEAETTAKNRNQTLAEDERKREEERNKNDESIKNSTEVMDEEENSAFVLGLAALALRL